jgi:hypothetical protein
MIPICLKTHGGVLIAAVAALDVGWKPLADLCQSVYVVFSHARARVSQRRLQKMVVHNAYFPYAFVAIVCFSCLHEQDLRAA